MDQGAPEAHDLIFGGIVPPDPDRTSHLKRIYDGCVEAHAFRPPPAPSP